MKLRSDALQVDSQPPAGPAWIDLVSVPCASAEDDDADASDRPTVTVNRYFAEYPEMVVGEHALRRGIYDPGLTYTCRASANEPDLETRLAAALDRLPAAIVTASPELADDSDDDAASVQAGTAADGATIKEGSYLIGDTSRLMQIANGTAQPIAIRNGKGGDGITARAARIIRGLLPIRDAVRDVLRAQVADQPWREAQVRLRIAHSGFVRSFGPINRTQISTLTEPETGDERETRRRTNLAPFADDPDCWRDRPEPGGGYAARRNGFWPEPSAAACSG